MKTKKIHDLILPQFTIESYFELSDQEVENSLVFIKQKHNTYMCGSIRINTKFINNKKLYVLVFEKKKKPEGTNFILVD